MTEQTIQSVKAEATFKEAERWRTEIRALHNDLAFMGDTINTHYVCNRLYALINESEVCNRDDF